MPFDGRNSPELWDDQLMVLEQGRELIKKGWTKHQLRDREDSYCAIGAISYEDGRFRPIQVVDASTQYLFRALPIRWKLAYALFKSVLVLDNSNAIEMFNDAPHRRKGRIVRLYNKAIKIRRKELNLTRKVGT